MYRTFVSVRLEWSDVTGFTVTTYLKYGNNLARPALRVAQVFGERRTGGRVCVCGLGRGL